MTPIDPSDIRYIKLGRGGCWEQLGIERGEIHFGYRQVPHEPCRDGDWNEVVRLLKDEGRSLSMAKSGMREIRDFYALDDCLWVTFAEGHLWWAFAEPEMIWLGPGDGTRGGRTRETLGGWRKTDIAGRPLRMDAMSTRLTQVASYRQANHFGRAVEVTEGIAHCPRLRNTPHRHKPICSAKALISSSRAESVARILSSNLFAAMKLQ